MRDDSATRMSGNAEANLGEHATGTTVPKQPFRAPSPSAMAARMRLNQALQKSDQRDDGVSASSSRRDPDRFSDPAAPSALLANSDSTVVKPSEKASTRPSTLRNLADVAGLSLQDTPPQVPVDSLAHPVSAANAEGSATSTDIDPDMLSAISKLVATKQAGAGSGVPAPASPNSDVSSLTRQIEQMAQRRRAQSKPPRPSPEDGSLSPRSKRSAVPPFSDKNPANLDLKHNDNSFHVVADLVLQPFKRGGTLSPEAQAQLHGAVSQQMRESFVEALQYRLKNNCPPGSSQHIHVVTRKCQVLGFDKEASENPLLSSTQVVVTEEMLEVNEEGPSETNAQVTKPAPVKLTAAETLALQQLQAELREASNFMAESKTKEASNFWRNHVLELQARLRTLQGDSGSASMGTDEDIMVATRRLLEETNSSDEERGYVPPSVNSVDSGTSAGASQSVSNMNSVRSYETDTTGSSEYAERGFLSKGGVMNQLAYLKDLYEMIDLLILLLEIDKILDFVDRQKIPEKIKDVFKGMSPENMEQYIKDSDFDKYFDSEFYEKHFQTLEDKMDVEEFMDDVKRTLSPEQYDKLMNDMTKNLLGPEQLREAMNLDKIRDMTNQTTLRSYFRENDLDKVWDLDKLTELMTAKKLREAMDANNIREVLKSQTMRDFMGNTYRGPNPMVDVVAPSNMPGGYRFEAQIEGHRFVATVPHGGVRKGETFSCIMKDIDSMYSGDIPVGGWRDRNTDMLINGVCHPVVWTTIFCPLLSLGQVMTRLKYDFLGRPRTEDHSSFAVMSSIVIMWITLNAAIFAAYNFKWSQRMELSVADIIALVFVNVAMWAFAIYATASTRSSIREKYMIREHRFYDLEDFCCATFAMPCTISQMARHTADYTKYEAACCTETGLEEGADLPKTGSNVSATNYFCADSPTGEYWCADEKDLV